MQRSSFALSHSVLSYKSIWIRYCGGKTDLFLTMLFKEIQLKIVFIEEIRTTWGNKKMP